MLLSTALLIGAVLGYPERQRTMLTLKELPETQQAVLLVGLALIACYVVREILKLASNKCLLLDIHCFKIPDRLKVSRQALIDGMREAGCFTEENLSFQQKIIERSGLGDETGLSDGIMAMKDGPIETSLQSALDETEEVIYSIVEELLLKTNVKAQEIGIVMVSCSCFAPTPSMAAMLVNKFKMREDILTYNLSGMGCSSSLVCVDMAKHMLKALPNTLALILNHENITQNWYTGNDRSMLVCNCLFRLGGAAALMSNRPQDLRAAKYELKTTLRTHLGYQDDAFGCMGVADDAEGKQGVFLRKNVIQVAGRALKANITALAPRVLPYAELARCALDRTYRPDFSKRFEHFLLHTGGRGVIDDLEKNLKLNPKQAQASKDTLYRFGNTSAASTWYILARIESSVGIRKGDRIWQLGFGGGFKCNSAVWKARRNIQQEHDCWA